MVKQLAPPLLCPPGDLHKAMYLLSPSDKETGFELIRGQVSADRIAIVLLRLQRLKTDKEN